MHKTEKVRKIKVKLISYKLNVIFHSMKKKQRNKNKNKNKKIKKIKKK